MKDPFKLPETYSWSNWSDFEWICVKPYGNDQAQVLYRSASDSTRIIQVTFTFRNFSWLDPKSAASVSTANCNGSVAQSRYNESPSLFPTVLYDGFWTFAGIIIAVFIYMLFKVFKR